VPFDTAEESAAVAEKQVRQLAELAEKQQSAALAEEFPYLAEVVAGHVAEVRYDFTCRVRVRPRPHPRRARETPRHGLNGAAARGRR
jgi:hypothetical protein